MLCNANRYENKIKPTANRDRTSPNRDAKSKQNRLPSSGGF